MFLTTQAPFLAKFKATQNKLCQKRQHHSVYIYIYIYIYMYIYIYNLHSDREHHISKYVAYSKDEHNQILAKLNVYKTNVQTMKN